MRKTKRIATALTGIALCSIILFGCSEDPSKKQEKKVETAQERVGRETAQNLQKPMEDARKATQLGTDRVQMLGETGQDTKPAAHEGGSTQTQPDGKGKKKLEGC
jgi:PBP1b-binding outer membrane lipoprotein LpoB